jgi:hypothetical protein
MMLFPKRSACNGLRNTNAEGKFRGEKKTPSSFRANPFNSKNAAHATTRRTLSPPLPLPRLFPVSIFPLFFRALRRVVVQCPNNNNNNNNNNNKSGQRMWWLFRHHNTQHFALRAFFFGVETKDPKSFSLFSLFFLL